MIRYLTDAIVVDGLGDDSYEAEVTRLLNRITLTQTGRAIFRKIEAHGGVLIRPNTDDSDPNAETRAVDVPYRVVIINYQPNTRFDTKVKLKIGKEAIRPATLRMALRAFGPDEILFHELVHAARLSGRDDGPLEEEEYFAVLIANIYMSEKGKPFTELRKDYYNSAAKFTELDLLPSAWLQDHNNFLLVQKFCRQHPNIAPMIAQAPAKFNPIRDFYRR